MRITPRPCLRLVALTSAVATLSLTSCMTTDPYTGEQKVSKTTQGAGIGAAAGGILGAIIGNNVGDGNAGRGALIGAAAGGFAGGSIGKYQDQQEAMLRDELRATGVSVTRQGNNIILNMPYDITFSSGSDRVKSSFVRTLNSVAIVLKKYNQTLVNVNGHTDSDGGASYNRSLSQRRARSVSGVLASRGVDGRRLIVNAFGESQPIASNNTSAGKAKNRRVEIHIVPRQ